MTQNIRIHLSDAFEVPTREPALELKVIQININHGHNQELMSKCKTLKEYAIYVNRVRNYTKKIPLENAVELAVSECINEGILSDFLIQYKSEAISMSIFEFDEEREMALIRRDEREIGREEGRMEGIFPYISLCKKMGLSIEQILSNLISEFKLTPEEADRYLEKYNESVDK